MSRALRRRATICAIAAALAGCQLVVPSGENQCSADGDCTGRGGDFANSVCVDQLCVASGDRCVGHVPDIIEDRATPLHTRLRAVTVGGIPIANVPILVCAALDEECQSPVGAPVLTDAAGYAFMTVWKNFRGTLQVKTPPPVMPVATPPDEYIKLKIHFLGAFVTDDSPTREISPAGALHLITRGIFKLQLGTHAVLDPNAGHIIAETSDCDGLPRPGIQVTATSTEEAGAPLLFYFTDAQTVSIDDNQTATAGLFGVVNVPEGPIVLEGVIASSGKKFGRVSVWVNKDTISNFSLAPTADP